MECLTPISTVEFIVQLQFRFYLSIMTFELDFLATCCGAIVTNSPPFFTMGPSVVMAAHKVRHLNSIKIGSNRMLLTAWKHTERKRHKNRKDYLLLHLGFVIPV